VHELELEVSTLRAHLDKLLDMPDRSETRPVSKPSVVEVVPDEPEPDGTPDEPESAATPAAAVPAKGAEKSA